MPKVCEICGKGSSVGFKVSASYRHTKRRFKPNLQTVTALVNGARKRITVCTACLKAGKVQKAG